MVPKRVGECELSGNRHSKCTNALRHSLEVYSCALVSLGLRPDRGRNSMGFGQALRVKAAGKDETRTGPNQLHLSPRSFTTNVFRGSWFALGLFLCSFLAGAANAQTFGCAPPM